jgi:pentose-5-phosphate-3-epimerase
LTTYIDATTAPLGMRAGASVRVAGTSVFGDRDDVAALMQRLRAALDQTVT